MSKETLEGFVKARNRGHGKTWYSKNMTKEAVVYIMSWSNIEAGRINISKEMAQDAGRGHPWSAKKTEEETEMMITAACKSWDNKFPKLAACVNPANGEQFMPVCRQLYHKLAKDAKQGVINVQVGLDRVRLFAGAWVTADCRVKLLKAHFGTEEEKSKYHHPRSNGDPAIRSWLAVWSMWCFIEHVGCLLITNFCDKAYQRGTYVNFGGTQDEFSELHRKLYRAYVQEKAFKLGGVIWNEGKSTIQIKELWKKRTKRCVTRFLIYHDNINAAMLTELPWAITSWMEAKGSLSMYPCDGPMPNGRVFSDWERRNCPWYMEYRDWNTFADASERSCADKLRDGEEPSDYYNITRLRELSESVLEATELEAIIPSDPAYDGKKARKEVEKKADKEPSGDVSQSDSLSTPTKTTSGTTRFLFIALCRVLNRLLHLAGPPR